MAPPAFDERFRIVSELGRGGMGVVYRAVDLPTGREVALKVVLGRRSERALARFEREGQLTARLNHPGIVRIHSSGRTKNDQPYLAYAMVQGQGLREAMVPLDLRCRVELIRDTARALGYAHAQGVVHRDVKPDNVLVSEEGRALVADFGLATAADVDRLTQTGDFVGTPSYVSPEQVSFSEHTKPGAPADVWSLGVVLYEALTDELPFVADNPVSLVGLIISATHTPPSTLDPRVPPALDGIVARALRKNPQDRYPDGEALAQDLDAWLEGRARIPRRRAPWAFAVTLLLFALGAWTLTRPGGETQPTGPPASAQAPDPDPKPRPVEPTPAPLPAAPQDPQVPVQVVHHLRLRPGPQGELVRDALPTPVHWFSGQNLFEVYAVFLDDRTVLTQARLEDGEDDTVISDGTLRCWDLDAPAQPRWEVATAPHYSFEVAVAPGGRELAMAQPGPLGAIMDVETQQTRRIPDLPQHVAARRVAFTRSHLVVVTDVGTFVYRWPALELHDVRQEHQGRALAISGDGRLAAIGGGSDIRPEDLIESDLVPRFIEVWDLESKQRVLELRRGDVPGLPTALALDPAGETLLVGDATGRITVVPVAEPSRTRTLSADPLKPSKRPHRGSITALRVTRTRAYSVDRVSGPDVAALRVWSYPEGAPLHHIERPDAGTLPSVALSPDGTRLVIGSGRSGTVEVFATATGHANQRR